MATEFLDIDIDELVEELLTGTLDHIVDSVPSISHHTGLSTAASGYESDLVLAQTEKIMIPGFDMKTEKRPVGPNGAMRGGLLTGPGARTNSRGQRYNVIPVNAEQQPGQFHAMTDANRELYMSANMLAEKAGVDAAMKFIAGATGGDMSKVYEWMSGRFEGAVGEPGNRTVFRTVSENSPAASWWYPPQTVYNPASLEKAMQDLESLLGGG